MATTLWAALLLRIVEQDADDLDALTAPFDPRFDSQGRDLFPEIDADLLRGTALRRPDMVCVGVRMGTPMPQTADRAMRIATFAAERDVEVVLLAADDGVRLGRFGFRVERVAGADDEARAKCEDQIRRFWNVDLVI